MRRSDPNEFAGTDIPAWLLELKRRNTAAATRTKYRQGVRSAQRYCVKHGTTLDEATEEILDAYQDWLTTRRLDAQTIRGKMVAVQQYCRFRVRKRLRPDDPTIGLTLPKYRRGMPRPMAKATYDRVLAAAIDQPRVRVCLILAMGVGLRVGDIANINITDLDLDADHPRILVRGKGGREDWLPLLDWVVDGLQVYLASLPPHYRHRGPLLRNLRKPYDRVCGNWVSKYCNQHLFECDVRDRMHSIRHSFGTFLIEAGVDVRVVQVLMRHASLQTTQIYTLVADPLLQVAIQKFPRPNIPRQRGGLIAIGGGSNV